MAITRSPVFEKIIRRYILIDPKLQLSKGSIYFSSIFSPFLIYENPKHIALYQSKMFLCNNFSLPEF